MLDIPPGGADGSPLHHRACGIQVGSDLRALVQIDAAVKHGGTCREGAGARFTSSQWAGHGLFGRIKGVSLSQHGEHLRLAPTEKQWLC